MKHYIINSRLLGDELMATPAIRQYKKSLPPGDSLAVYTSKREFAYIHDGNDIPVIHSDIIDDELGMLPKNAIVRHMDTEKAFWDGVKTRRHMSECFAEQLGLTLDDRHYNVRLSATEIFYMTGVLTKLRMETGKKVLICGCHSTSDSSMANSKTKPNKMLSGKVWSEVMLSLTSQYYFVFLSAKDEPKIPLSIPQEFYRYQWLVGRPIREVAALCKVADAVVSIDCGVGHLAAAVDANIVSINAAVPAFLVSVNSTNGKYHLVDHNPDSITSIGADEIIDGILKITQ